MEKEPAFVACCITHSSLSPPTPPSCVLALTIPRPLELRNGNRLPLAWLPIYNSHYPPRCPPLPHLFLFLLFHHAAHASHMLHTTRNDIFYFYLFCSFSLFVVPWHLCWRRSWGAGAARNIRLKLQSYLSSFTTLELQQQLPSQTDSNSSSSSRRVRFHSCTVEEATLKRQPQRGILFWAKFYRAASFPGIFLFPALKKGCALKELEPKRTFFGFPWDSQFI